MAGGILRDLHAHLLVYACDLLNAELPPGLQARVDERLAIEQAEDQFRSYVPDIALTERWDRPAGLVLGRGGGTVPAAEPTVIDLGEEVLRRVEDEAAWEQQILGLKRGKSE